jgi:hypothetical protein
MTFDGREENIINFFFFEPSIVVKIKPKKQNHSAMN